jgi:ring-1,2-phenylacetyl-CoA epoxidase subunit PaaD
VDKIQQIWHLMGQIPDPEIPVISIVELGVVRDVKQLNSNIEVDITPTYSGCPAMTVIRDEIGNTLKNNGFLNVNIKTVYSPAWTTDWMTVEAKQKLKDYGIAPPDKTVLCPRCGSVQTALISQFGSTPCKALYRCTECKEPFDYFKCH